MKIWEVVDQGCEQAGITAEQLWVTMYDTETHFGNWVLTPIQYGEAARKLAKVFGPLPNANGEDQRLDMHRWLLTPGDIDHLQVGDKVTVKYSIHDITHYCEIVKKGMREENGQQWVKVRWYETRGKGKRKEEVEIERTFNAGEDVGIFLAEVDPSRLKPISEEEVLS